MKNSFVKINNSEERMKYLRDRIDFGAYTLVKYNDIEELLYFVDHSMTIDNGEPWFLEAPCYLVDYGFIEDYESRLAHDMGLIKYCGKFYEIESPQIAPFLPDEIEINLISCEEALGYMVDKNNRENKET
jgi:hypothetical protein